MDLILYLINRTLLSISSSMVDGMFAIAIAIAIIGFYAIVTRSSIPKIWLETILLD